MEKRKIIDNTIIIFLSDNGGEKGGGVLGKLDENKGGQMSAFCGQAWATLQNTPFRLYKAAVHEGGTSTPFIVHWPKGIKKRGAVCKERSHIIDLMPTFVELAGAHYPGKNTEGEILPMEGRSIVPVLKGESIGVPRTLCWAHAGNSAILEGNWKLVSFGKTGAWELYDIAKDRSELEDLSGKHNSIVKELESKWDAWAARTGVTPYPSKEDKQEKKEKKEERKEEKKKAKDKKSKDNNDVQE